MRPRGNPCCPDVMVAAAPRENLCALICGLRCYFISPLSLITNTKEYLQLLARVRATHTPLPNFALRLATNKVYPKPEETLPGGMFDLSALKKIAAGSEPTHPEAVKKFCNKFNINISTVHQGYGLAENVLQATTGPIDAGLRNVIVGKLSCG